MASPIFTAEDASTGGYFELAIKLPQSNDTQMEAALLAVWQHPQLNGCYLRRDMEPDQQQRSRASYASRQEHGHLLGVATLPNGSCVACGMCMVREDGGRDWLVFYIPTGALGTAYEIGAFPFGDQTLSHHWQQPLNDWLVEMARAVFAVVPYSLALLGHEVSGVTDAADVGLNGVPSERWDGYLWLENGQLEWYPPTRY